jgi:hypothetical protein
MRQEFQRSSMRNGQQKNSFCALSFLFPAQGLPGEYDQTTLKFSGFRKQTAFLTRVKVHTPLCSFTIEFPGLRGLKELQTPWNS